jgi:hypothetical protein
MFPQDFPTGRGERQVVNRSDRSIELKEADYEFARCGLRGGVSDLDGVIGTSQLCAAA